MKFKNYLEATDIFGFTKLRDKADSKENVTPTRQFNVEQMMEYLSKKNINGQMPTTPFVSEIRWGFGVGSIKLEVDTGFTFHIKKLHADRQGTERWVHKRMFQLNRNGVGGTEDIVANEIYDHLKRYHEGPFDGPNSEPYKELDRLVNHCYSKMKLVAKDIFIPEGVKRIDDNTYVIQLALRGHGVEAPNQQRVEQNQTMFHYDDETGLIRIFNYNVESPTGGSHDWKLKENDLDIYFFPSQSREEISECLAVHFKYY